jgi:hypothetical protein
VQHRHLLTNEIDLLLDGEAGFGVAPLRAHVEGCAECRTRLDEARVVADALERLPHFAPRHDFAERVLTQVHIVEPWHVAALDTVRGFVPASRPLRVLAMACIAVSSVVISASTVWIALSANLTLGSATVVTARLRHLIVLATQQGLDAVFGFGAAEALRANGTLALTAGGFALIVAVSGAALGFRALVATSRQRGS